MLSLSVLELRLVHSNVPLCEFWHVVECDGVIWQVVLVRWISFHLHNA